MQQQIKAWLAPPIFPADEAKTRRARLLNAALINILTLIPVLAIGNALGGRTPLPVFAANATALVFCLILRAWMHRGQVRLASVGLIITAFVLITASIAGLGTIRAPATAMYLLLAIAAGLLFDLRGMVATTALCSLAVGGLILAENAGGLPRPDQTVTITQWVTYTALCGWAGSLTLSAILIMRQALAHADQETTERKRIEEVLRESETRFRQLFVEAPLAYQSLDSGGRLIDINQAWLDLLGYARDEVLGRWFGDFLAPHELAAFEERFAHFKTTGAVSVELDMVHRSGATILTHITGRTKHDEHGQFKHTHCILQDITERKRMERRLRDQQAQLSAVLENSNASVWAADRDYRLILGNGIFHAECRAGLGRGIAEGESVLLDFLSPAEKEEWKGYYDRALQGESYRIERERKYSPAPIWNEYHLGPIRDETGQCVGATILAHDITERKRAEEGLRQSQHMIQRIADTVPYLLYVFDLSEGRNTYINRQTEVFFGHSLRQLQALGQAFFLKAIHPDDLQQMNAFNSQWNLAEDGQVIEKEYRLRNAAGEYRWIRSHESIMQRDAAGVPIQILGSARDITERKRVEDALRASESWLRTILANAPITIFALDKHGIFTLSDGKGLEYVGLKPGENVGVSASELYGTTSFLDPTGAVLSGQEIIGRVLSGEAVSALNELRGVWFDNHIVPLRNLNGEVIGAVGVAIDITERKRADQALTQSREHLRQLAAYLQGAREEERAYVAREIHDEFGQTLTALKMDLSWLARRLPGQRPDLAAKVNDMEGLVDEAIHTVRRIATELRPGLLDDLGLVAAIEWQAQEFARRTGLGVDLNLGEQDVALDNALSTALFRILQETLTNVARHAKATRVVIELDDQPDLVTLVIADNGLGIESAQAIDARSLGLLGMRERAHALGGDLTITSHPGQGTTVTVRIPRVRPLGSARP